MMKKFVAIALVLTVALSLFGCGRVVDRYDERYTDKYYTQAPTMTDGTYSPGRYGYDGPQCRRTNVTDVIPPVPTR